MKTALQIYTLRDTILQDTSGQLAELKRAGYDGAELVNFGGDSVEYLAGEMKKAGLEVFSIHTCIDEVMAADEKRLGLYASLGCTVMPIGSLPEDRLPGGKLYAVTLEAIGRFSALAEKHGIRLVYHNHDFDLEPLDGVRKLDILLADTAPDILGAELDTCWIYTAGADPLDYVRRYAPRCPVLHLKDCVKEGGRKGFRAIGEGALDFAPIIGAAKSGGVEWLCVEQDEPSPGKTPMECALMSIAHLKTLL